MISNNVSNNLTKSEKKRLIYLLALLVVEVVWSNVFEEDTLGRRGCEGCGL